MKIQKEVTPEEELLPEWTVEEQKLIYNSIHSVFTTPLTFASVLHGGCLKLFGDEYINWEPEIVADELHEAYENIPEINLDKIQGVSALLCSETYYLYWESFEKISRVLNSESPFFNAATPLDSMDLFWAVTEAKLLDPDEFSDSDVFSPEVYEYIYLVLKKDGVIRIPPFIAKHTPLGILQKRFKPKEYTLEQEKEQRDFEQDVTHMLKTRLRLLQAQSKILGE